MLPSGVDIFGMAVQWCLWIFVNSFPFSFSLHGMYFVKPAVSMPSFSEMYFINCQDQE